MVDKRTVSKMEFSRAIILCGLKEELQVRENIAIVHINCDRGSWPDCRGCTTFLKYEHFVDKWIKEDIE